MDEPGIPLLLIVARNVNILFFAGETGERVSRLNFAWSHKCYTSNGTSINCSATANH